MNGQDLDNFKAWFSDYCKTFYSANEDDQRNISLKEIHTHRVCGNIIAVADGLFSNEGDMLTAETIALFHDAGRFPQYTKYKTFNDSISVNHGLLGANILLENKIIQNIPQDEQDLIIQAVKFHNAFRVPDIQNDRTILFLKLIRDADKLDIFRVFTEYYENPEDKKASAAGLGLPDTPGYSDNALSCLYSQKVVSHGDIKNINDLKLLQLSWLFDLNFATSFRLLLQRDYINKVALGLPDTKDIQKAIKYLNQFAEKKAKNE